MLLAPPDVLSAMPSALFVLGVVAGCMGAGLMGTSTAVKAPPAEAVLFDFADPATGQSWYAVNDNVMGGISTGRLVTAGDVGVFTGDLSLENFGGFATVRALTEVEDLSAYDGLAIRVRGDGKRYALFVKNHLPADGKRFQVSFDPGRGQWRTIRIPFSRFRPYWRGWRLILGRSLRTDRIRAVGFMIADKQAGPFRLEIQWVKAYR